MRDLWVSIFGQYTPIIDEITGEIVGGVAGLDFTYIFGAIAFLICLYSFLKYVWVLLKNV